MIPERIAERRRGQPWMRRSNYMSDIGHECERFLVYARTHWDKRIEPDDKLRAIFNEGNIHEEAVLADIRRTGLKVTEEQVRLEDKDTLLSGKIDCIVTDPQDSKKLYLVEIKSMSPYIFDSIEEVDDMKEHKSPWVRHYPAQMQCYLYYYREKYNLEPDGIFLLKNKVTGWLKEIRVTYDADLALDLMLKAERINRAIAEKRLPARIPVHKGLCEDCGFRLVCLPDQELGPGAQFIDDDELLELMRERAKLEPLKKEFERLDELIKKQFKDKPGSTILLGEFVIEPVAKHRDSYVAKASDYVQVSIRRRLELQETSAKEAREA